jgi:TPR repeat protein
MTDDTFERAREAFLIGEYAVAQELLTTFQHSTNAEAMNILGEISYCGLAGVQDTELALRFYKISAALGNVASMLRLANHFNDDLRTLNDARRWFSEAAATGSKFAKRSLGVRYLLPNDDNQKAAVLRAAAIAGNEDAMFEYGLLIEGGRARPDYLRSTNIFTDHIAKKRARLEESRKWYLEAAAAGCHEVINFFINGLTPVRQVREFDSIASDRIWFTEKHRQDDTSPGDGSAVGSYLLAKPAEGKLTPSEETELAGLLKSERRQALYFAIMGFSYNHGYRVYRDRTVDRLKAFPYLEASARYGNHYAMGALGGLYLNAQLPVFNPTKALAWTMLAKRYNSDYSPPIDGPRLSELERSMSQDELEEIYASPNSFI